MTEPSSIALHLLAHARLCREVARESAYGEMAQTLDRLAEDCVQAARIAEFAAAQWNPALRPTA
jgi:hypothetical protein